MSAVVSVVVSAVLPWYPNYNECDTASPQTVPVTVPVASPASFTLVEKFRLIEQRPLSPLDEKRIAPDCVPLMVIAPVVWLNVMLMFIVTLGSPLNVHWRPADDVALHDE